MVLCLVLNTPGSKGPDELDFSEGFDAEGSRDVPGRKIAGIREKFSQDQDNFLQIFVPWMMELTSLKLLSTN